MEKSKKNPQIDYTKIPYKEKRSVGECIKSNSFYMPKYEENSDWYYGYDAMDFFGLETKKIIPLNDAEAEKYNE